jgi:hypothetical protein
LSACLLFYTLHEPKSRWRYLGELRLGVSLLFQIRYAEASPRLINSYNCLRPPVPSAFAARPSNIRSLVDHLVDLRDGSGAPLRDVALNPILSHRVEVRHPVARASVGTGLSTSELLHEPFRPRNAKRS